MKHRPSLELLPLQEASALIAQSKYFLPGEDLDGLRRRLAHALAQPEARPGEWEERFYKALHYAWPGGRVMANAGAGALKPDVSTINCTVSRTIPDSMDGIMQAASEAALTLKAGCGIGYDFTTLRPRGAVVAGRGADTVSCDSKRVREAPHRAAPAPTSPRSGPVSRHGAATSGPLPFMDVFDAVCKTVSSAGGRRGAQMGCLDIGHPDIEDFITAKRENGRLRAFNLSCLITDAFIAAVQADGEWPLVFPASPEELDHYPVVWRRWPAAESGYTRNSQGETACRVYRTLPARALWELVMRSTYEYSDPGFILIDRVNRENPLWFCEDIRASNPCVTGDTWVHTEQGPQQAAALVGRPLRLRIDGQLHETDQRGFFSTGRRAVFKLKTREGYTLRLTADHRVLRIAPEDRWVRRGQWCAAGELQPGQRIALHNHREATEWQGEGDSGEGYLLGLLVGDGTIKRDGAVLSVWRPAAKAVGGDGCHAVDPVLRQAESFVRRMPHRADFRGWFEIPGRNEFRLKTAALSVLAQRYGLRPQHKTVTREIESTSSDFHRGFLRGFFDSDGSVQGSQAKGVSVRLAQSDLRSLEGVQRMLLRLGVVATLYRNRRGPHGSQLPDGRGGTRTYASQAQHELVVSGDNLPLFAERIGFADADKATRLKNLLSAYRRAFNRTAFVAEVAAIEADGEAEVFDVSVPGVNAFDANGIYAHNCGEQMLPPFGSCLLGSVNLAALVRAPFTPQAAFDWTTYDEVVQVFARMLDNVVEINGLPLPEQRAELVRKRRHGMGYFGLGSALTMLNQRYGGAESVTFTDEVTRRLALGNWQMALALAQEKGPAPILSEEFELTPELFARCPQLKKDGYKPGQRLPGRMLHARYSRYFQRLAGVAPQLVEQLAATGARYTHATSIAPTGTMAASVGDNASNGIEPSFAHRYIRNMIVPGEKAKRAIAMESYELRAYRQLDAKLDPEQLPESFRATAADTDPRAHVAVQAAAQRWVDASISKCVLRGTRILTNKGVLPVQALGSATLPDQFGDALQGLAVMCADGKWRNVRRHYCGGIKPIVFVRLSNGHVLAASTTHRLMGVDGWVRMADIRVGGHVMLRRDCKVEYSGQEALPPLHIPRDGRHKDYAVPSRMSPEFALFLGMLCSDGHMQLSNGLISLTGADDAAGSVFSDLAKNLFRARIRFSVDPRNQVRQWSFNSKPLCSWLVGLIGERSHNKHAPSAIFAGSLDERRQFLRGLTLDGYRVCNGGREWTVLYEGRSERLARDAYSICRSLGWYPSIASKKVIGHDYTVFGVRVPGFTGCIEPLKDSCGSELDLLVPIPVQPTTYRIPVKQAGYFTLRSWWHRGSRVAKESSVARMGMPINRDIHAVRVAEVWTGAGEVFDIEVEETHDYLIDGVISHNTINVPADTPFEEFEHLYLHAIEQGLKGCTTFRYNPAVHQGVLVSEADLAATIYEFQLADGTTTRLPGNALIEYEGRHYTAANLYDALKEGYYGKL